MSFRSWLVFAVLLTASGARAEGALEPFVLSPAALLRLAEAGPAAGSANYVSLLEEGRFQFQPDGARDYRYRKIFKIVTAAGVRDNGAIGADWAPWYEDRPELRARVITPDGKAHDLDPSTIEDARPEEESDTYSDQRMVRAPLPALTPGAIVEEEILVHQREPFFPGGSIDRFYFGERAPSQLVRLIVEAPKSLPLKFAVKMPHPASINETSQNGTIRRQWELGPLAALEPLADAAPVMGHYPYIEIGSGRSWQTMAAAYQQVAEQELAKSNQEELARVARETIAGAASPVEIADRLLARLRKDIRYTGVEFGRASIVPRTPDEVLKRGYGDCKDQALLLTAWLRAVGLRARLALLSAGLGEDLDPDLPGFGKFNHAIVVVDGAQPLWLDPTSEFARAGELPLSDQGRLALIVDPTTRALKATPSASYAQNRTVETREFFLSEDGPARVVETSESFGSSERGVRAGWKSIEPKAAEESLGKYVTDEYAAKKLSHYEHSSLRDLSSPFRVRLEVADAARGTSSDSGAAVAIFPAGLVRNLPESLYREQETARTADYQLYEPLTREWRYRVVPPPGFAPKPLPAGGVIQLGPVKLETSFAAAPDGVVTAMLRLETPQSRLTAAEVETLRAAYKDLDQKKPLFIGYFHVGQTHRAAGRFREAIQEYRRLIALHPNEARHHLQLSEVLLDCGLGASARKEAERATQLEPGNADAQVTLGFAREHDLIGRLFGPGADLAGAEADFRKAKQLDPKNLVARADLAILFEYASGERYAPGSRLPEAVTEYRALEHELGNTRYSENVLYDLLWLERWKEMEQTARALPVTVSRNKLLVVAVAGNSGAAAAARTAEEEIADPAQRTAALQEAGQRFIALRRYPLAVEMLEAASMTSENAVAIRAQVDQLRQVKRAAPAAGTAPVDALRRLFVSFADDKFAETLTRSTTRSLATAFQGIPPGLFAGVIRRILHQLKVRPDNLADLIGSLLKFTQEGDDRIGYRIRIGWPAAGTEQVYYVVREAGAYKIAAFGDLPATIGTRALELVNEGNFAAARTWLAWAAEGRLDQYCDAVFLPLWKRVSRAPEDEAGVRLAAATLAADGPRADQALAALGATGVMSSQDCDLATAQAYASLNRPKEVLAVVGHCAAAHPDSAPLFAYATDAMAKLGRWTEAAKLADARLLLLHDDVEAIRVLASAAEAESRFDDCAAQVRRIVASGAANYSDYNRLAWNALIAGHIDERTVEDARQAVALSNRTVAAALNTLAAVMAERGEAAKAREILLEALSLAGRSAPDSADYYVLGRIAELLDMPDDARAAYSKVEPEPVLPNLSSSLLARRRLAVLGAPMTSAR